MTRYACLLLPALLSACGGEVRMPDGNDTQVQIKADGNGQVAFNLPFANGQMKLPTSMLGTSGFDIDGVKMIPGGKVTGFNVDAKDGQGQVNIGFSAPVSPAEARAYFLDQFKAKGVTAALAGDAIAGTSKDGANFTVRFTPDGATTNGTITIADKG